MRRFRNSLVLRVLVIVAPFAVVQAGRVVGVSELHESNAATTPPPPPPLLAPTTPASPAQELAVTWSRQQCARASTRSPLGYGDAPPPPPVPTVFETSGTELGAEALLATLKLNSIMGHGPSGIAVINKRMVRQGDEIIPGWHVGSINARERHVELLGPDGRTMHLDLDPH